MYFSVLKNHLNKHIPRVTKKPLRIDHLFKIRSFSFPEVLYQSTLQI